MRARKATESRWQFQNGTNLDTSHHWRKTTINMPKVGIKIVINPVNAWTN
ncbi:uncharacterized protein G2W53_037589 [Senna tora]|uniref:Uncharacterized protein n=1 Tax=Senna tora TaxID=362788 RepID=A0A834W189_9FABA|nr:uncharacterized protein G2W53_037589 [Senna tora]